MSQAIPLQHRNPNGYDTEGLHQLQHQLQQEELDIQQIEEEEAERDDRRRMRRIFNAVIFELPYRFYP